MILAHMRVARIARGRRAALLADRIPLRARPQLHVVVKRQRPAHVGAGGSVVAEERVERAVLLQVASRAAPRPSASEPCDSRCTRRLRSSTGIARRHLLAVRRGARRYGARRYWQGPNEQFSQGTRSVSRAAARCDASIRRPPAAFSWAAACRNRALPRDEGKRSLRVRFINSSRRGCSAISHSG